jgi:hypothetical protein
VSGEALVAQVEAMHQPPVVDGGRLQLAQTQLRRFGAGKAEGDGASPSPSSATTEHNTTAQQPPRRPDQDGRDVPQPGQPPAAAAEKCATARTAGWLSLDPALTAAERAILHDEAAALKLGHASVDNGGGRAMLLWRRHLGGKAGMDSTVTFTGLTQNSQADPAV